MLEKNRAQLNETDCSNVVRDYMASSTVCRIRIARIEGVHYNKTNNNQVGEEETIKHSDSILKRPRSNYYANKADADAFLNPILLYLPDQNQDAKVRTRALKILTGFPTDCFDDLHKIVMSRLWSVSDGLFTIFIHDSTTKTGTKTERKTCSRQDRQIQRQKTMVLAQAFGKVSRRRSGLLQFNFKMALRTPSSAKARTSGMAFHFRPKPCQ